MAELTKPFYCIVPRHTTDIRYTNPNDAETELMRLAEGGYVMKATTYVSPKLLRQTLTD